MKTISVNDFKYTLKDISKYSQNRKYCFIIGAGASKKSGIPTGAELAEMWYREIEERSSPQLFDSWKFDEQIDEQNLSAFYGIIYRKRFELDKTSGYEFLIQAMKNAEPSLGHIILSQILALDEGHCVITTNFDNLIESSIYQYTEKTPLVCGHESLSGYARPSTSHPLVIKIHRDLLLQPKSEPDEINSIDPSWKTPLDLIFASHIPIIIGYGGNDGSLMKYFEQMNNPTNFFWCGIDETKVSKGVKNLIISKSGCFVKIRDFDSLMNSLLFVFNNVGPIKENLNLITEKRVNSFIFQMDVESTVEYENEGVSREEIYDSMQGLDFQEKSAYIYGRLAEDEPDYEKRKNIYIEALDIYPETGWLWWGFTYFLHFVKHDYENLKEYYEEALKYNFDQAGLICNYALFLKDIAHKYVEAELYFQKAMSIDPNNSNTLANYAYYISEIKKDYVTASELLKKAISIDPNNSIANVRFALHLCRKDTKNSEANKYFLKAVKVDPLNADTRLYYANYLANIGDNDNAEKQYAQALFLKPDNPFANAMFSSFLHMNKNDNFGSKRYLDKAISLSPDNYHVCLVQAIYLKTVEKNIEKAQRVYEKAINNYPNDPILHANLAQILFEKQETVSAILHLDQSFQLNQNEENALLLELWIYRYAHQFELYSKPAEVEIEKLIRNSIITKWDFSGDLKIAFNKQHPNLRKLESFISRATSL